MKAAALLLAGCVLLLCPGCEESEAFDARAEWDKLQRVLDKLYAQPPSRGDADTSELTGLIESYTPAQLIEIARLAEELHRDAFWYEQGNPGDLALYYLAYHAKQPESRDEVIRLAGRTILSPNCSPAMVGVLADLVLGETGPKGLANAGVTLDQQMDWMAKLMDLFAEEDARSLSYAVHLTPSMWGYIRNRPGGEVSPDQRARLATIETELVERLLGLAVDTRASAAVRKKAVRQLTEDWVPGEYRERILEALTRVAEEPTETLIPDLARDVAVAFRKLCAEERITPYLTTLSRQEPGRH